MVEAIESKLREEEWVIYEWSPVFLRDILQKWYFRDDTPDVSALRVWQDTCHYLYLPRLVDDAVFRNAITNGIEGEDFFGFAAGKEDERYLGFVFGDRGIGQLDQESLLIERETARAYKDKLQADAAEAHPSPVGEPASPEEPGAPRPASTGGPDDAPVPSGGGVTPAVRTQFYGTIHLDPIRAKMDFANIMDEVVEQFTARTGVEVKISVDIEAVAPKGFDESLQRTVRENCNVLRFKSADFEGGEDQ